MKILGFLLESLVIGMVVFYIFKFLLPNILHFLRTRHIRKDAELWLMYITATNTFLSLREKFHKSPSYSAWVAAFTFAALENCIEDNNISHERFSDVAIHLLDPFFKKKDRQKVIDYYMHGSTPSNFHEAVLHAKEYLLGKPGSDIILNELSTMKVDIPGV
ncbi:MAG: hypothetical protein COW90_00010 [Nitrospirae bacterium CG22_combo_CG10-13_8_21_14_all_44_11]|nr:MAG: hypothetical protein COW90_00010 [Nitrospirae bacterium CG22_combo_CG10-13_8_21_14_all_44_11]